MPLSTDPKLLVHKRSTSSTAAWCNISERCISILSNDQLGLRDLSFLTCSSARAQAMSTALRREASGSCPCLWVRAACCSPWA